MTKAFNTEMCNQACYDCIQCHGGKGYMRTKLPERYYRDARITNIYEGTTRLQIVAAIGGVMHAASIRFSMNWLRLHTADVSPNWPASRRHANSPMKRSLCRTESRQRLLESNGKTPGTNANPGADQLPPMRMPKRTGTNLHLRTLHRRVSPEITRQHQTVMAGDRGCIAQLGKSSNCNPIPMKALIAWNFPQHEFFKTRCIFWL